MSDRTLTRPHDEQLHHGNLLNAAVRRDITGLNRLFLEHVLDPASGAHPWFRVPSSAVARLTEALPEVRERAAGSPVALFEVTLPDPGDASVWRSEAVADEADPAAAGRSQVEMRRSFGLAALEVVRRLVEGVPLAPRIAFGLAPVAEAQLATLSIAESYRLASWPGLIRPRWPAHTRYWEALTGAASGVGPDVMRWVYSTGLCLLGQCERQPVTTAHGPRRLPRPAHRRGSPRDTDVPC
ncbi:MAG TPA: hypothetical protein VF851_02390 [Steroidobacteraceae bacterium]